MANATTQSAKKPKEETLYKLTFKGMYHTRQPGVQKPFELEGVIMTRDMVHRKSPLSVFKKDLADALMPDKYPDYVSLMNWEIKDSVQISGTDVKDHLNLMGWDELVDFAARYDDGDGMDLKLPLYKTPEELRQAIKDYIKDPEGFRKLQAKQYEIHGPAMAAKEEALRLNNKATQVQIKKSRDNVVVELPAEPEPPEDDEDDEDDEDPDDLTGDILKPNKKKTAEVKAKNKGGRPSKEDY